MRASSVLVVLLIAPFTLSCQAEDTGPNSPSQRLSAIETRIADGQRKLDQVESELRLQAERMEVAKQELAYQECRVKVAEIRAETERRKSECAREISHHNLCEATNAKQSGEAALVGCLFGIVAATASGGAAAPWALGGCGAGYAAGEASAADCPTPSCIADLETIEQVVLKERSLSALPRCGGSLGANVEAKQELVTGVRIEKVGVGTAAATAGLAPGDVLAEINGRATRRPDDLPDLLATFKPGARMKLTTYRKAQRLVLTTRASRKAFDGTTSDKIVLGIHHADDSASVLAQVGVRIASMRGGAPATGHLRVGDVVTAVSHPDSSKPARVVATVEGFLSALDDFRPGQEVRLDLVDESGAKRSERVKLGPAVLPDAAERPLKTGRP